MPRRSTNLPRLVELRAGRSVGHPRAFHVLDARHRGVDRPDDLSGVRPIEPAIEHPRDHVKKGFHGLVSCV
jgi:hypothetical protein